MNNITTISSLSLVLDRYLATINQASDVAKANDVSVGIGFFRDTEHFAYSQSYLLDSQLPIYGNGDVLVASVRPDGTLIESGFALELRREASKLSEADAIEAYESMLDDCFPVVQFGDLTYLPSTVLKAVDPVAYRAGLLDYIGSENLEVQGY